MHVDAHMEALSDAGSIPAASTITPLFAMGYASAGFPRVSRRLEILSYPQPVLQQWLAERSIPALSLGGPHNGHKKIPPPHAF